MLQNFIHFHRHNLLIEPIIVNVLFPLVAEKGYDGFKSELFLELLCSQHVGARGWPHENAVLSCKPAGLFNRVMRVNVDESINL